MTFSTFRMVLFLVSCHSPVFSWWRHTLLLSETSWTMTQHRMTQISLLVLLLCLLFLSPILVKEHLLHGVLFFSTSVCNMSANSMDTLYPAVCVYSHTLLVDFWWSIHPWYWYSVGYKYQYYTFVTFPSFSSEFIILMSSALYVLVGFFFSFSYVIWSVSITPPFCLGIFPHENRGLSLVRG